MGTNTITTIIEGTGATVSQLNQYKTALTGDLLPRNAAGEVEDKAGSVGSVTAQVEDIHMDGAIYNGGVQGGFCPSGVMLPYTASATVAPTGWIFADGSTIGAAGSGATHTGEEFRYLFNLYRLVSEYGNAGSEDFDSLDIVYIPNPDGRFVRSTGAQNPDGSTMGETQSDQNLSHSHSVGAAYNVVGTQSTLTSSDTAGDDNRSKTTSSNGGSEARPRAISFPYIIKV